MKQLAALLITLASLPLLTCGCGVSDSMDKMNKNTERMASQIEQDQQYIKSITETSTKNMDQMTSHMDRMATQIEQDQQYIKLLAESLGKLEKIGTAMFSLVTDSLFVKVPPPKSDDIDDVLKGPTLPAPPRPKEIESPHHDNP